MDITARIKLHGEGGEQLAQEFRKGTKELEKMGDAAKNVKVEGGAPGVPSGPGAPVTPAEAAVSPDFAARMAQGHYNRDAVNARKKAEAEERESKNQSQKGGRGEGAGEDIRGAKGRAGAAITSGLTAIKDVASGDMGGAVTAVGKGIESIGTGTGLAVGGAIASIGAGLLFQQALARSEQGRVSALWGSGLSQRMGLKYDTLRAYMLQAGGKEGIPEQVTMRVLEAFGAAGGRTNPEDVSRTYTVPPRAGGKGGRRGRFHAGQVITETQTQWESELISRGERATMAYGLSPDLVGRTMGLQMQAGFKPQDILAQSTMGIAEAAFGRGLMGRFITRLADATEMGMTKGMIKGSDELLNVGDKTARIMSAFVQAGVTPTGAEALSRGITEGAMNQSVQLRSPGEFRRFMRLRQPGEDYFTTLKRMASPDAMFQELKVLQKNFRGRPKDFKEAALSVAGMEGNPFEFEAKLAAFEKWKKGGILPGTLTKAPEIDKTARDITAGMQTAVFEKFEKGAAEMVAALNRNTLALAEHYKILSDPRSYKKTPVEVSAEKRK